MHLRLTTCLLLALPGALAAQPASAQARDRVENIAGWRVSSGDSGDGGYDARLERRGRGWSFSHLIEYWRGNNGVSVHDEFHGNCRYGAGENGIIRFWEGVSRPRFDRQLASYLRSCPLPRAEAAAMRRSLDRAWPVFMRHARRQRAGMDAELARIARGGG